MSETLPAVQPKHQDPVLAIIDMAARDPTVDVAKMQQLLDMRERVMAREAKIAYSVAMRAAQSEMQPVVRDAENKATSSRYARLETIDKVIRPVYTRHGFSLSFNAPATTKDSVTISCTVMHDSGHSERHELTGALDTTGAKGNSNKTDVHGLGSSVSYFRRYLKVMIFDITLTNEDNDGNGVETVNQDELNKIEDMLIACQINAGSPQMERFYNFAQVSKVQDIRRKDVGKILQALRTELKKLETKR